MGHSEAADGARSRVRKIRRSTPLRPTKVRAVIGATRSTSSKTSIIRARGTPAGISFPKELLESPVEIRQLQSAWVTPELDRLRSDLLIAGLRLHETTLRATQSKAKGNLSLAAGMLRGAATNLTPQQREQLWDILFFTAPVFSTTLASFSRLFVGLDCESLGWVLIDEAGRATTQRSPARCSARNALS